MEEQIGYGQILSDPISKLDATFEKCDATFEKITEQLDLFKSALQSFVKMRFNIDIDFDTLSESPSSSVNPVSMDADAQQVFDEIMLPNLGDVVEDQDDLGVSNEDYSKVSLEDKVPNLFDEMPRSHSTAIIENQHVSVGVDGAHVDAIGGEGQFLSCDSEVKCDYSMTLEEYTTANDEIYDQLDDDLFILRSTSVSPAVIENQQVMVSSEKDNNREIDEEEVQLLTWDPELQCDFIMNIEEVNTKTGGSSFMVRDTHFLLLDAPYAYVHVQRVLLVNHGFWVFKRRIYEYKTGLMSLGSRIHGSLAPVHFSPVDDAIFLFDPGGYGFGFLFAEVAAVLWELGSHLLLLILVVERYTKAASALEPNESLRTYFLMLSGDGSMPYLFYLGIPVVLHNPYTDQFLCYAPRNGVSNKTSMPIERSSIHVVRITNARSYMEAAFIMFSFASPAYVSFVSPSLNTIAFTVATFVEKTVTHMFFISRIVGFLSAAYILFDFGVRFLFDPGGNLNPNVDYISKSVLELMFLLEESSEVFDGKLLCIGSPEPGKTMLARAKAGELIPFFPCSSRECEEMLVAFGVCGIMDLFAAKTRSKSTIFINEIDAILELQLHKSKIPCRDFSFDRRVVISSKATYHPYIGFACACAYLFLEYIIQSKVIDQIVYAHGTVCGSLCMTESLLALRTLKAWETWLLGKRKKKWQHSKSTDLLGPILDDYPNPVLLEGAPIVKFLSDNSNIVDMLQILESCQKIKLVGPTLWFILSHPCGQGCFAGEGTDGFMLTIFKVKLFLNAYFHDLRVLKFKELCDMFGVGFWQDLVLRNGASNSLLFGYFFCAYQGEVSLSQDRNIWVKLKKDFSILFI